MENIYTLSPMQEGLLFSALYQDTDEYLIQWGYEIEGEIDLPLFRKAWEIVVAHHSILRSGFIYEEISHPVQYVSNKVELPWSEEDWLALPEKQQLEQLGKFIRLDRKERFDLKCPPLMRFKVIRRSENRIYFLWTLHHLLLDGWCGPILHQQVMQAYEQLKTGQSVRLPYSRPYEDYIAWILQQDHIEAKSFWKNYLENIEEGSRLDLGRKLIDNERLDTSTHNLYSIMKKEWVSLAGEDYGYYEVRLEQVTTNLLITYAARIGVTANTIVQGVWAYVLSRYTGQKDVVFGVTVSGRSIPLPGIEEMIGLFINTLPLRVRINAGTTIKDYFQTIQKDMAKLNEYGYLSLAEIQGQTRFRGRHELFNTLFVFENYPIKNDNNYTGYTLKGVCGIEKAEYPLTLTVVMEKELCLKFSYQTNKFGSQQIKWISNNVIQVLKETLKGENGDKSLPSKYLYMLSSVTSEDRRILLNDWNATELVYPQDKTVIDLFEEQVERHPDNIAIVFGEEKLTYRELNQRINQVAHYLRSLDVKKETLVAISLERSFELIVGILGIWKAGGAYIPLDPEYPEERLQFMLKDTQAPVLITTTAIQDMRYTGYGLRYTDEEVEEERNLQAKRQCKDKDQEAGKAESEHQCKIILMDDTTTQATLKQQSVLNPIANPRGDNLAYVIYTSGSTGQPKGVMIEHKSLYSETMWLKRTYALYNERILQLTSSSFDPSIWEILMGVCSNNRLILYDNNKYIDVEELIEKINLEKISIIQLVPSLLSMLLKHKKLSKCLTLRCVFVGSEILHKKTVEEFFSTFSIPLWNLYGPTESTIDATYWECKEYKKYPSIPIGKPISNTKVYILDDEMRLVPIGAVGEIYIGGSGLARGYLNRPELTAEKFIANPFVSEADRAAGKNLRLYKTGDLGRYLPDGNIEFKGRMDDQVKIRGFRIELGEIESALNGCAGVEQSVVIARSLNPFQQNTQGGAVSSEGVDGRESNTSEGSGDKRLIGYVVPSDEVRGTLEDKCHFKSSAGEMIGVLGGSECGKIVHQLHEEIGKRLPKYMVPQHMVLIEKIPLTSNGKVDRKSFPDHEIDSSLGDQYVAPSNEVEAKLCEIWAEVLRLERVGIHDNFFTLGGNSITAINLVSQINKYYHSVKIADIFNRPNVVLLADLINRKPSLIIPLNIFTPNAKTIFMIHGGLVGCEIYGSLAKIIAPELNAYGVDYYNLYNENKISDLNKLARYYLDNINRILSKSYQPFYILLGVSFGGQIALEIANILEKEHKTNKKILVILLDTVLQDEYMLSLQDSNYLFRIKQDFNNYAKLQNWDSEYINKIESNFSTERLLVSQKISDTLYKTHILLFKAMLETNVSNAKSSILNKHILKLPYNNVDKICSNTIKMVKCHNSNHNNILTQEIFLKKHILSFLSSLL